MKTLSVGGVQECTYGDDCHRWCTRVYQWRHLSQVVYKGVPMKTFVTGGVQGCTNEDICHRWCTRVYQWRHLSQVVYNSVPMKTLVTGGVQGCTNEDTCHRWCTRVYQWRHLSQVVYKGVPMKTLVTGGVQEHTYEDACRRWCTRGSPPCAGRWCWPASPVWWCANWGASGSLWNCTGILIYPVHSCRWGSSECWSTLGGGSRNNRSTVSEWIGHTLLHGDINQIKIFWWPLATYRIRYCHLWHSSQVSQARADAAHWKLYCSQVSQDKSNITHWKQ